MPKALSSQEWYNEMSEFLFHACRSRMVRVLEITSAANCNKTRHIINSVCCFINSQLLPAEENCLYKVHIWLNHRNKHEDTLDVVCERCKPNLCALIIYKELNFSDKSYIITRKRTS